MNLQLSTFWQAVSLGVATEVVLGVVPGVIVSRMHFTAEAAAPIFYTHIPGLLAAGPLFVIENPRNAGLIEPIEVCVTVAAQVLFWGWMWRIFLKHR